MSLRRDKPKMTTEVSFGRFPLTPDARVEKKSLADVLPLQRSCVETARNTVVVRGSVKVKGAKAPAAWTGEFPEDPTYEGLTLLIPGWGGIEVSSSGERTANAKSGRATFSLEPTRATGSPRQNWRDAQALHTATIEAVLDDVRNNASVRRRVPSPRTLDFGRLLLSSHSMGGYSATDFALKHPGQVDSIIYKASAGFGFPTLMSLHEIDLPAFAKEFLDYIQSGEIELSPLNMYRIVHYYARTPSRTAGEARTCLTVDQRQKVLKLGEMGVKTGFLAFGNDPLIVTKKVESTARLVVDELRLMPGFGHLAPQRYPREVARAAFDLHASIHS